MKNFYLPVIGTLLIVMALCLKTRKLSLMGTIAAGIIGLLVFLGAGIQGLLLLFTFFICSVAATSHKRSFKASLHQQSTHTQTRNAGQVLANGGIAGLLGLLQFFEPAHQGLYGMMMAASLASALADTLSSELGTVYGQRFFNILTFAKDQNGLDGVVSIEGTFIGAAGAALIALEYSGVSKATIIVALAGVIGNLVDSILGGTLERKHYINNDTVNFLNTLVASLIVLPFS